MTSEYRVDIVEDRPEGGVWHCGPNACWVTVTHLPSGVSATAYHPYQHKAREYAMDAVKYMLADDRVGLPAYRERMP
jgi:protein subunit release factor A